MRLAARRGDPKSSARLFGAAEALGEAASVAPAFPPTRALYEQDLASTRAQLDAETLEAARAEGRALTLTEAAAEALQKTG